MIVGFLFLLMGIVAIIVSYVEGTKTTDHVIVPTVTVVVPTTSEPPVQPTTTSGPIETVILYDTFTEAGASTVNLSTHTPEIGGPWQQLGLNPENQLVEGSGYIFSSVSAFNTVPISIDWATKSVRCTYSIILPSVVNPGLLGFETEFADATLLTGFGCTFYYDTPTTTLTISLLNLGVGVIGTAGVGVIVIPPDTPMTVVCVANPDGSMTMDFNNGELTTSGSLPQTTALYSITQFLINLRAFVGPPNNSLFVSDVQVVDF